MMRYNGLVPTKTLQIREIPESVYERLKLVASRERRSLSQQALHSLEIGLAVGETGTQRRRKLLADWQNLKAPTWADKLDAPADLVRDDRDR